VKLPNVAVHWASSRQPTEIRVNVKSGAYTTDLNSAFVSPFPFGKVIRRSPTPSALNLHPSAVIIGDAAIEQ
jgi:hypothetical protein